MVHRRPIRLRPHRLRAAVRGGRAGGAVGGDGDVGGVEGADGAVVGGCVRGGGGVVG